jgi:hypothetical protein
MKKTKKEKGPINYLKCLDIDMRSYPPYSSWDASIEPMFSFFVIRYPFLRPAHPPEDSIERKLFDLEEELFWNDIQRWKNKLEKDLPRIVDGLNAEQRIQLSSLAVSCVRDLAIFIIINPVNKSLLQIAKQGEVKIKMLRNKLKTAMRNLSDLQRYAFNLDEQYGFKELPTTVEKCLAMLGKFQFIQSIADDFRRCRESGEDLHSIRNEFTDPSSKCMVRVYWFFRHECNIPGDESEVRVALIRNEYWGEWVEPISFRPEYQDAQSKGCEAVHTAVLRFGRH